MKRSIVAVLLVAACACGGDDGDSGGVPDCSDLYADGEPVEEIIEHNDLPLEQSGCISDGEQVTQAMFSIECDDGRTVNYNEFGWAFDGEGWHYEPSDDAPDTAEVCA